MSSSCLEPSPSPTASAGEPRAADLHSLSSRGAPPPFMSFRAKRAAFGIVTEALFKVGTGAATRDLLPANGTDESRSFAEPVLSGSEGLRACPELEGGDRMKEQILRCAQDDRGEKRRDDRG